MFRPRILFVSVLLTWLAVHGTVSAQVSDSTATAPDSLSSLVPPAEAAARPVSANPEISVIGDFRMHYNHPATRPVDAELHEAEFAFRSTIDPYARADFYYSAGRNPETGEYSGAVEDAYLTTLSLPFQLQLKAGRFRSAAGKMNTVHPHALPVILLPFAYTAYFGEEGMKDDGLSLSWLAPNPAFYQELTLEVTNGPAENPAFATASGGTMFTLAHLKNFWDLSDNTTLELGASAMSGANDSARTTTLVGGDLTLKWKPLEKNTYRSLTWQSEFFYSMADVSEVRTVRTRGWYSMFTYQIAKRWFATARYDVSNRPMDAGYERKTAAVSAGWYATEFQKIEVEGSTYSENNGPAHTGASLRWIFVIGSHGAHAY